MRLPVRLLVTVASTLLVLVAGLGQPATAGKVARYADDARASTNVERKDRDLRRVREGACLQRFAKRQAVRMADQERLFHQDLDRVVKRCGLRMAGENVAYGYSSGHAVVNAWMGSTGHRKNILKKGYRRVGLAARRGDNGLWYVAQVFGRNR